MPRIPLSLRSFRSSLRSLPASVRSVPTSIRTLPGSAGPLLRLRSTRAGKYSATGVAAASVAALAVTLVPGSADTGAPAQSSATKVSALPTALTGPAQHADTQQDGIARQLETTQKQGSDSGQDKQHTGQDQQGTAPEKAETEAQQERRSEESASRDAERSEVQTDPTEKEYPNNLDGWIREALAVMDKHDIPGSYEDIHRNIMRESSGNPNAVNNWDINAQKGTPSKGLLQVIRPTFEAYHVPGTSWDLTDPVANIVAACNYAADRYGSINNVYSAY